MVPPQQRTDVTSRCSGCGKAGIEGQRGARLKALGHAADQQCRQLVAHGIVVAVFGPQHHQQGGQAVGPHGFGGDDSGSRQRVLDGGKRARIDQVRIAPAVFLAVVAIVARGGDGLILQLDQALRLAVMVERGLDGDQPGMAARFLAGGTDLARDLDQIVVDALVCKALGQPVDDVLTHHTTA